MTIDKNTFFRDFTLSICSSLHIETAMQNTFHMLSSYMPIDKIIIGVYDYDTKIYKLISQTQKNESIFLNQIHPLPANAIPHIRSFDRRKAQIFTSIKSDPILYSLYEGNAVDTISCLLVPLTIDSHIIASAQFYTQKPNMYTSRHVELMSLVNQPFCIAISNVLEHIDLMQYKNKLNEENSILKTRLNELRDTEVIGSSNGMKEIMEMTQLVAPLNSPVLILGETGTGKELIANTIYKYSSRNRGPFVKVNCGAIPDSLIDSELFGHEKGAFTGAVSKKIGYFERAHMGTIFLDEIGELPLEAQVRLLRVIQEREIERVGGTEPIPLDIRIICATNRNLTEMTAEGTFREDLFYRINVFPIMIPPLRQRTGDIPEMLEYFICQKSSEMGLKHFPQITEQDIALLCAYSWPGNVRELQNIIERAIILCKGNTLDFHNILPELYTDTTSTPASTMEDTMKQAIINALIQCHGRISGSSGAAALLKMNPSTLRNRMIKLKIENIYR